MAAYDSLLEIRMSTLQIQVSDELLALLNQHDQRADRSAIEMIVLELYRRGSISSGKAAELLAVSRIDFIHKASSLGIALLDMTDDEWAAERLVSESL
jgi:predicted HTH domain antitoxin